MSLTEIQDRIQETGIQPQLNSVTMMKELTWQDQWIGYDDEETVAMKTTYASASCFGGTMAWSVDFHSGTGNSDTPPLSTDGSCGTANGGSICRVVDLVTAAAPLDGAEVAAPTAAPGASLEFVPSKCPPRTAPAVQGTVFHLRRMALGFLLLRRWVLRGRQRILR
jgi:hypothetical protein